MTENQAKEILELELKHHPEVSIFHKALSTAIQVLEEKKAYKPIKRMRHRGGYVMEHCPCCNTDYQVDRRYSMEEMYCGNCGKLLDSGFGNYCANCGCAVDRGDERK